MRSLTATRETRRLGLFLLILPCAISSGVFGNEPTWVDVGNIVYGAKPDERGPIGGGDGYASVLAEGDYTAENLDALDTDRISWDVIQVLTVPGFGDADSDSSFTAVLGTPPGLPENCSNGVDDDCDGYVDSDDSDCGSDVLSGYAGVANAEAASHGSISLSGSGSFNALSLLLAPTGTVIFLRALRRRTRSFRNRTK